MCRGAAPLPHMIRKTDKITSSTTQAAPRKFGRQKSLTPQQLAQKFEQYKADVANNPFFKEVPTRGGVERIAVMRPMTIVGYCNFAGIAQTSFYEYAKREPYADIIARVREEIEENLVSGAVANIFNANLVARILHISDHQDVTTNGQAIQPAQPVSIAIDKAAASIIQSVGPSSIKPAEK